jgi:hypothetical protein
MRLIGAGLPRTATLSQKVALEMLGLGPCYHMVNVLADLRLVAPWRRALERQPRWEELFAGFQSTVDWPGAFFYRELLSAYPDAKVLLSVRDAEAWERSMRRTIWGAVYGDTMMRDLSRARARIDPGWREYVELMAAMWERSGLIDAGEQTTSEVMRRGMERYNEQVRATVPAQRLLVWSPADGWEPLCAFLDLPVPDVPFPHLNDSDEFAGRIIDGALAVLQHWRAPSGSAVAVGERA